MLYSEWKNKHQEEFNRLPLFWAFSDDQFKRIMEDHGLTENDTDKVYAIRGTNGCFYFRKDADVIRDYFSKPDELSELLKDYDFCEDAVYYEMCNHEYGINWQADWDVMSCFGNVEYYDRTSRECHDVGELTYYFNQLGWNDAQRRAYAAARSRYMKQAIKNDWI